MKIWKEFIEKNRCLVPAWDRLQQTQGDSTPFCVSLKIADGLKNVINDNEKAEYQVRLSLFDIAYKQFFGRTWCGPVIPAKSSASQKPKLNYNQNVYLHTSLNDLSIAVVVEIVAVVNVGDGQIRKTSCGWGMFRLFKYDGDMKDTSSNQLPPTIKMDLYHGSPRALLFIDDPVESNENLQRITGCQLSYSIRTHDYMRKMFHLLPENVIVGSNDIIPGIVDGHRDPRKPSSNVDNLMKPKLLKTIKECYIEKVSLTLQPSIDKFEEELCSLLNEDRINRDNKIADGTTVTVTERRLQVGVHNGWCYVDKPQVVHLETDSSQGAMKRGTSFKRTHQRTASSSSLKSLGNSLILKNKLPLDDIVQDPMYSIVFMLEYVLSEPVTAEDRKLTQSMARSQTVTIGLRWTAWTPFSSSDHSNVSVQLHGGSTSAPDEMFMYKLASNAQDDISSKITATGSLNFSFVLPTKKTISSTLSPGSAIMMSQSSLRTEDSVLLELSPGQQSIMGKPPIPMKRNDEYLSDFSSTPRSSVSSRIPQYHGMVQQQAVPPPGYQHSYLEPHTGQMYTPPVYQQPYGTAPAMMPPNIMISSPQMGQQMPSVGSYQMDITHVRGPGSPDLQELPFTPIHAPIMAAKPSTRSGQGLSRAAYARLYTAGFPAILDRHGDPPDVVDPADHVTFILHKEITDSLQVNEIVFQFLAFSRLVNMDISSGKKNQSNHGTLFFTFQFYRFPQVTSERLLLGKPEGQLSADPKSVPCVLQKINGDGSVKNEPPGYQVKYNVDPSFLKTGEGALFIQHMSQQILHIDIWDGDSLLLIGSCAVDLKPLCRQGREAVQTTCELDVINTEYSEDTPSLTGDVTRGGSVRPVGVSTVLTGRLHLRMANIGNPLDPKLLKAETMPIVKTNKLIVSEGGSSSLFLGGSLNAGMSQSYGGSALKRKKYKAQPVVDVHRELASVLVTHRSGGTMLQDSTDNMDAARKRKLARMQAIRQQEGSENQPITTSSYKQNQQERTRDLKTIDLYRQQTKKEGILSMLNTVITTEHVINPSMGSCEFFEFVLKNPYNIQHTVTIQWDDSNLSVITDAREWRYFKQLNQVQSPVEEGMFNKKNTSQYPQIFLRPKESVNVPFKYTTMRADHTVPSQGPSDVFNNRRNTSSQTTDVLESTTSKVYFNAEDHKPISILRLSIEPMPHVIDQTFRFYHPEQSFLKKAIRLPPFQAMPGEAGSYVQMFSQCSDSNVICETKPVHHSEPQDVYLKVAVGASPQIKKFFVSIYSDPYLSKPIQIWQFYVHALQRVDVACIEGQTSRFALILRGTQSTRLVQCFSSHPNEMQIEPKEPFMLTANAVHEINIGVRALQIGTKFLYVNVVDIEYHQLIRTWLVCATCKEPIISKAFELILPIGGGKGCNKRISYRNPYPHKKIFNVRSNRNDLLQFKESKLTIGPNESHHIGLRFAPSQAPGVTEILIFINDEDDKNEETFCVKAIYSHAQ